MKFAISGKGGVGKTTLAALLAQVFAEKYREQFLGIMAANFGRN